ncbi:hypothetical protein [Nocardioides montaniterrae]
MNHKVRARMATQNGLITRRQAIDLGMTTDQIDRLRRRRAWVAVQPGVYAEAAYLAQVRAHADRRLVIDRAASLRVGFPHVMSHHSAAYELGLEVLHEPRPITRITRPGLVGTHHRRRIVHHLAPYDESDVVDINGRRVLSAARAAADIAREHGFQQGLVAADSAFRAGATARELDLVIARMAHWPNVTVVRDVRDSASDDTDSIGETLSRDLVTSLGYGVPQVQFGLAADGQVAWCDLRLGRHIIEFNRAVKLLPVEQGGFSSDPMESIFSAKRRQDFVCGFKLGMSHLEWHDVFGAGIPAARERVRREYLDTCSRFGTDVSDLGRFMPRLPRRRPTGQSRAA